MNPDWAIPSGRADPVGAQSEIGYLTLWPGGRILICSGAVIEMELQIYEDDARIASAQRNLYRQVDA